MSDDGISQVLEKYIKYYYKEIDRSNVVYDKSFIQNA